VYGDCCRWVFCVDVVNCFLCVFNEFWYVCVGSSVNVYNCVDWVGFVCCLVYFDDDCRRILDVDVVYYSGVYVFVYIYCNICFVYCFIACDLVAVLICLVGQVVVW